MTMYIDTPCDRCIHIRDNIDNWKCSCDAFPEGWPKGWSKIDVTQLEECCNGIKFELEESATK